MASASAIYSNLFLLALLFSCVSSEVIYASDITLDADNNANGQCQDKPNGESRILLNEQKGVARICHGRSLSSVLQLQCDFQQGTFELFLNGSLWVDRQEIKLTRPRLENKMVPLLLNKAQCPFPRLYKQEMTQSYTYFNDAGTVSWSGKLPNTTMEIRSGRLYYETDVYLDQTVATARCTEGVQQSYTVHLSCCANPLITDELKIIPPSHEHCPLDACKLNPRFECKCVKSENAILLHVETKDPAVTNSVGVEIVYADFFPSSFGSSAVAGASVVHVTPEYGQPQYTVPPASFVYTKYAPRLTTLGNYTPSLFDITECSVPTPVAPLTAVREIALDDFQFESDPEATLRAECKVRYCQHASSFNALGRSMPSCRPEPQLPRSATCPTS